MVTMFSALLLISVFVSSSLAGTMCPQRENIYPCTCINIAQTKKLYLTIVTCHHLQSTDSLEAIFPTLRSMRIDVFHLYDSFWHADTAGGKEKNVLPTDWLLHLKIKELEIVDTPLSPNFACQSKSPCRNSELVRFTARNSSSHEKITTVCTTRNNNGFSWIGCMKKLGHFHFSDGKLTSIDTSFFPMKMDGLLVLNLTHNEISIIDEGAFNTLPRLKSLDLSHNMLTDLENIFTTSMNLEFLDVSWNHIDTLGDNFFKTLPFLRTLKADNNEIVDMEEKQWEDVPVKLINIDLSDNPIHCDCSIQWINSTFGINVSILGTCATPEDYENSKVRVASRALNQRCIGSSIGTRSRQRATTPLN